MRNNLIVGSQFDVFNVIDNVLKGNIPNMDFKKAILAVDIKDESDKYTLYADIPGVNKEDVKITFDKGVLNIEVSERSSEEIKEGENFVRRERSSSKKIRSFDLGDSIDESKIEASINDGVLTLLLPKKESYTISKEIEIK